jgi:hypothetical protein
MEDVTEKTKVVDGEKKVEGEHDLMLTEKPIEEEKSQEDEEAGEMAA